MERKGKRTGEKGEDNGQRAGKWGGEGLKGGKKGKG